MDELIQLIGRLGDLMEAALMFAAIAAAFAVGALTGII